MRKIMLCVMTTMYGTSTHASEQKVKQSAHIVRHYVVKYKVAKAPHDDGALIAPKKKAGKI